MNLHFCQGGAGKHNKGGLASLVKEARIFKVNLTSRSCN